MAVGTLIGVWEYFVSEVLWELESGDVEDQSWKLDELECRKILLIVIPALKSNHPDFKEIWEASNGEGDCKNVLEKIPTDLIKSEILLLKVVTDIYLSFKDEIKPQKLANEVSEDFASLLDRFFKKFSLRYSLRKPFGIIINIESVFSDLYKELDRVARLDPGTKILLREFEEEFSELLSDVKERKVKSVISKASNFTERFLIKGKGVRPVAFSKFLRENCRGDFPHEDFKLIAENLYGFSCDFIGIRHGGGKKPMLRDIQLRDAILSSFLYLLLAGHLHPDIDQDKLLKV